MRWCCSPTIRRRRTGRSFDRLVESGAPSIHLRTEVLSDPTDYGAIHAAVVRAFDFTRDEFGADADLAVHVSPGTPAMQAVWVLLAKTRYPAELIQSHPQTGVRTVSVPFDIAAEYVPALLRHADAKIERLTTGLPTASPAFDRIVGRSPLMDRARARARRVAPHHVIVLIEGASGTGKELFARAIHAESRRARGRFEDVNCGALPEGLVESLLFGHERGAFSGAVRARAGHFEAADGGTLFLDEIGELPPDAQVKLLRTLQEKTVRRLGADRAVAVDVRVIAATNRDLAAEVAAGRFREDLYYRLATGVIRLPPLRERQGDLTPLIDHFLAAANRKFADQPGVEQKILSPKARNLLLRHLWPGNVRELQATMDRLVLWTPARRHRGRGCGRGTAPHGDGRVSRSAGSATPRRPRSPGPDGRPRPSLPGARARRGSQQQDASGRVDRAAQLPDTHELDASLRRDAADREPARLMQAVGSGRAGTRLAYVGGAGRLRT